MKIENNYSECDEINYGVSHGIVLGQLLLLIYINDIILI